MRKLAKSVLEVRTKLWGLLFRPPVSVEPLPKHVLDEKASILRRVYAGVLEGKPLGSLLPPELAITENVPTIIAGKGAVQPPRSLKSQIRERRVDDPALRVPFEIRLPTQGLLHRAAGLTRSKRTEEAKLRQTTFQGFDVSVDKAKVARRFPFLVRTDAATGRKLPSALFQRFVGRAFTRHNRRMELVLEQFRLEMIRRVMREKAKEVAAVNEDSHRYAAARKALDAVIREWKFREEVAVIVQKRKETDQRVARNIRGQAYDRFKQAQQRREFLDILAHQSSEYVTTDNIDAKIAYALDNPVSYNASLLELLASKEEGERREKERRLRDLQVDSLLSKFQ